MAQVHDDGILELAGPKEGAVVVGFLEDENFLALLFAVLGLLDSAPAVSGLDDKTSLGDLAHQEVALHEEILLDLTAGCELRNQQSMLCH